MPDKHAKLSASGAKKWLNCPLSVTLENSFPDESSPYAKEGTTAHALGELKLRLALGLMSAVEYNKEAAELDTNEDLNEYIDGYRDFVLERYNGAKATTADAVIKLEQRLDFSAWVPEGFGTGDVVIISEGLLEIIDLKYGAGVPVSAENNPQLRLYGLGAVYKYDYLYNLEKIKMTIYQPRLDHISSEELSWDELRQWAAEIGPKAQAAYDGVGQCNAGKHCDDGFCKARPVCRAYAQERSRLAVLEFARPDTLTDEEIAEVIDQSERLTTWAKLVKDYALAQALNGKSYPGFKIVEGRSNRTYCGSEAEIEQILNDSGYREDEIINRKLKGITDLEKLMGKSKFNTLIGSYITKPQGKPVLVHTDDKRPAIGSASSAMQDFK